MFIDNEKKSFSDSFKELLKRKYSSIDINDTNSITNYTFDVQRDIKNLNDFFSESYFNFTFINQDELIELIKKISDIVNDLDNENNVNVKIEKIRKIDNIKDLLDDFIRKYQVKLSLFFASLNDLISDYSSKFNDLLGLISILEDYINYSGFNEYDETYKRLKNKLANLNVSVVSSRQNGLSIEARIVEVSNYIMGMDSILTLLNQLDSYLDASKISLNNNYKDMDYSTFDFIDSDFLTLKEVYGSLNRIKNSSKVIDSYTINGIYDIDSINISSIGSNYFNISVLYNGGKFISVDSNSDLYPLLLQKIIKQYKRKNDSIIFIGEDTRNIFLNKLKDFDYDLDSKEEDKSIGYRIDSVKKYMSLFNILLKDLFSSLFGIDNLKIEDINGFNNRYNISYSSNDYNGNCGLIFSEYDNSCNFTLNLYINNISVSGTIKNNISGIYIDWESTDINRYGNIVINKDSEISSTTYDDLNDNIEFKKYSLDIYDEDYEFVLSYLKLIGFDCFSNIIKLGDYSYMVSVKDNDLVHNIYLNICRDCGFILVDSLIKLDDSDFYVSIDTSEYYLEMVEDTLNVNLVKSNNECMKDSILIDNSDLRSKIFIKKQGEV